MNATSRIERPDPSNHEASSLGHVVAQSPGRTIVLGTLHHELRMGDRLVFSGVPQVLGVVTGFETPLAEEQADPDGVVFIEVQNVGVLKSDGSAMRSPAQPPMGADAYRLPRSVEIMSTGMVRPVMIGEVETGQPIPLDAASMLGRSTIITGDSGSGKSATLAVIMRALLADSFPARQILIDPDGLYANCFGKAATVVDFSALSFPAHLLTLDEMAAFLSKVAEPMAAEEHEALAQLRARADGQVSMRQLASLALEVSDTAGDNRELFVRLASRFEALLDDPRFAFLCGGQKQVMTAGDILQNIFRLPVGQPPSSVVQLHQLASELRPLVTSVLLRFGLNVAQSSGGAVPVLMFVDRADAMFFEMPKLPAVEAFGLVLAGEGLASTAGHIALMHRCRSRQTLKRVVPSDEPLAEEVYEQLPMLSPGECLLMDPDYPWPVRFTVSALPDKAIPQRLPPLVHDESHHTLLDTILSALAVEATP